MRTKLFIILLIFSIKTYGQKYFIPYVENGKMGLIDEKGNLAIPVTYDKLSWQGDRFFVAENELYVTDTLRMGDHYYIRENEKTVRHTIIYNGKIILDNLPHSRYEFLLDRLIIAELENVQNAHDEQIKRFNLPQGGCITLFNTKGDNLYPDHFYKLQKIDTANVERKGQLKAKYILFAAIDLQNKHSLFAYNLDTGTLSDWIVKNAENIRYKEVDTKNKKILFEVTDENYITHSKTFSYSRSNFKLENAVSDHLSESTREEPEERYVTVTDLVGPNGKGVPMGEGDMKPTFDHKASNAKAPKNPTPILKIHRDSLFLYPDKNNHKDKKHIALKDHQRLIQRNSNSYTSVMVQEAGRFRFLNLKGTLSKAYDSLFYYGNHFVAKRDGKFGVINEDDSTVVPLEYDTFQYRPLKLELAYHDDGLRLVHKTPYDYSKYRSNVFEITSKEYILAHKDGKVGLLSTNFKLLLPVDYDYIVKNGIFFTDPRQETPYIAKKDKHYVIFNSLGIHSLKEQSTPFDFIPVYYYEDYYNIQGMTVYALYDELFNFKGFISSDGKKFYK